MQSNYQIKFKTYVARVVLASLLIIIGLVPVLVRAAATPLPPTAVGIFNNIDSVQTKVENAIPPSVLVNLQKIFTTIDAYRVTIANVIVSKRTSLEKKLQDVLIQKLEKSDTLFNFETNTNDETSEYNPLEMGIIQFEVFLLTFISYIFTSVVIFYICLALLLYWLMRAFYRLIRGR
ncbi:hypothetical protein IPF86_03365 [Candidatus Nomurabacteria bacterium]|nr:MAG: hypothetical protein IPF86_03365 [Candidatus Nomurabacteria bacterium]